MYLKVDDIIEWVESYNQTDAPLKGKELETFIKELHNKIAQMDFSVNEGTTIIAYSGFSNGEEAWKIAKETSKQAGKGATYISDLPAGTLIGESKEYNNIIESLKEIKSNIKGEVPKIKISEEKIRAMMAELEEIRRSKEIYEI